MSGPMCVCVDISGLTMSMSSNTNLKNGVCSPTLQKPV